VLFREITSYPHFYYLNACTYHAPAHICRKAPVLIEQMLFDEITGTYTNDTENSSLRGWINGIRWRDSTGAVYSRSLMFFSCLNSYALFAAYHDFPLKIVSNATFVAT